jgi:hypothetical protein
MIDKTSLRMIDGKLRDWFRFLRFSRVKMLEVRANWAHLE